MTGGPSPHRVEVTVELVDEIVRLDKFLSDRLQLFPRSQYERRGTRVELEGKTVKPSLKLSGGERLTITWEDLPPMTLEAQDLPLDIVFENSSVVVVNKARGMVVHPANGNWSGTLVQALLFHNEEMKENFQDEEDLRPGIVHRLDKDTTGLLVTAKTPGSLEFLSQQFRSRTTEKIYWALLKGEMKSKRGQIATWLGRDPSNRQRFAVTADGIGKHAETSWRILAYAEGYHLVELRPKTGRTHQLRVHAAFIRCPIVGDPLYSRPDKLFPQAPLLLHAARLTLTLPGEDAARTFIAPLPQDFRRVLLDLGLPDPLISE